MSDSEDGAGVPLIEPDFARSPSPGTGGKRKREDDSKLSKRAKKLKTKKPKNVDNEDLSEELGLNLAIGRMDSKLLADYMAQRTKRFEPDLSMVELEDRYVPEKAILDTSSWEQQRDLDHLPAFLMNFSKSSLKKASKEKGRPHTLVVAMAGLRAADIVRPLRKFEDKGVKVAKLFAKHIKLQEAIDSCKKLRMNIGVGTPKRIIDLLDNGALSAESLQRIVIDASHIDVKKRGIMDMKEVQVELAQLLAREELKSRYGQPEKKIEVLFY
ncbi:Replication regulator protein [Neofusicoccum parvum]|uniref:Putative replication regulator protein n=1 Tax=Botryosphaeria parva (strain UCR-NP2) TaxID=1287680 RepID=R1FZT6_BOTPV|nr:putative replication regulator protein [Neofusicoccum parvum UCRNP2]GME66520.1 Replication regulator protein [Neofusicoccum parvum]